MKTFYCVCVCVCVYVWNISLAQNSHLFIYLFRLSLFRVAPFSENTAFQGQGGPDNKMLQLKKQIYACTVTNNNLSQELYSFNITLGSILQHFHPQCTKL